MSKTLVLFDFDGTLTKHDTLFQFIFFAKGKVKTILGFLLLSPFTLLFALKIWNAGQLKMAWLSYFFKNESESNLLQTGKRFIESLFKQNEFNEKVLNELQEFKKEGAQICIVSASANVWIASFAKHFELDHLCTELEMVNGSFTGNFSKPNCNKAEKAKRIKEAYDLKAFDEVIAYGNSSGDNAMFELAHKTVVIK